MTALEQWERLASDIMKKSATKPELYVHVFLACMICCELHEIHKQLKELCEVK